jgi:dipeptidyl-peptidase-4
MKLFNLFVLVFLFSFGIHAQKPITIDDIFAKYSYRTKSVSGFNFMNDGRHYSALKEGAIKKFDITTGGLSETIFDGQKFKGQAGFSGD